MKSFRYSLVIVIGLSVVAFGCQKTHDTQQVPLQRIQPGEDTQGAQPVGPTRESNRVVTTADVLEALGMDVWKDIVNPPDRPLVRHVALCVKSPGSKPRTVMEIDIADPELPGTLLVFLQEEFGGRYRAGIVYHGKDGLTSRTNGPLDDPFKGLVGVQTETGASIVSQGIIILKSSNFRGLRDDVEADEKAVVIYLRNE